MATPTPDIVGPDDLVQQALTVIQADRLPYLATVEGDQPRLRPIAPVKTEGFTVYVANLRSYGKTAEIESNPRVELCYLDGHHDQVRITGMAEVVTDPATKEEIWNSNPHMRKYLVSVDDPDFILYRISPSRVRFMKEWALTYREVPFQRVGKGA
jgi:general stress protein 26